jgi:hypothetical protein
LPQSMPAGAIVGRAVAPHRNTSANTRIVELVIANDRWGTWKAFSLYCASSKWGSCDACHRYPTARSAACRCCPRQQQQVLQANTRHPVTTDQFPSSNFRTETLRIFSVISAWEEVVTGKKKNHQEPHTEKKLGATLVTLSTVSTGVVHTGDQTTVRSNFQLQLK